MIYSNLIEFLKEVLHFNLSLIENEDNKNKLVELSKKSKIWTAVTNDVILTMTKDREVFIVNVKDFSCEKVNLKPEHFPAFKSLLSLETLSDGMAKLEGLKNGK